ncbi:MAG: 6-phospho-beta-glucosidase, partial [Clostridia bacterium]
QFAEFLNVGANDVVGECYGLNHLSFFNSIKANGKEVLFDLISNDEAYEKTDLRFFDKELLLNEKQVPNEYLYYFYYREKAIDNILKSKKTRGETIMEINKKMTEELSSMDIENDFESCLKVFEKWYGKRENAYMASETGVSRDKEWKFDIYSKDDGGYAGVALKYIEIVNSNKRGDMILCAKNGGAIKGLKDDDIVEITCTIENGECVPHKFENVNELSMELIRRVKAYERLASQAIREKSKRLAIDALYIHPLVNSYSLAREIAQEFFELNANYLQEWR